MKEYWVNVYYHSLDKCCYQGKEFYKTKYQADLMASPMFANGFKPKPILAYRIHVKMDGGWNKRKVKPIKYDHYYSMPYDDWMK